MKIQLRWYQRRAVRRACKQSSGFALFGEQGTGKTLSALAIVQRHKARRLLVVGPKTALDVWPRELQKCWSGSSWRCLRYIPRKHRYVEVARRGKKVDLTVVLITYQSVWRRKKSLVRWNPDFVIVDESQNVRKRTAKQSKGLKFVAKRSRFRLILSGTPVDASAVEIWNQFDFLDPTIFGSWGKFTRRYCRNAGWGYTKWVVRKNKIPAIKRKIKPYTDRVTKKVLKLPPVTRKKYFFNLPDKARAIYDELEKEAIVQITEDDYVYTPLVIVKLIRLRQLTGGFLKSEEKKFRLHRAKVKALENLIKRKTEGKVVIYAAFLDEIDLIVKRLGCLKIDGRDDEDRRIEVRRRFAKDPTVKYVVCQIRTGGVGINEFVVARHGVFYSLNYSWIDYDQALSRLDRDGQKYPVTLWHVMARDTIDEKLYQHVRKKGQGNKLLLDVTGE